MKFYIDTDTKEIVLLKPLTEVQKLAFYKIYEGYNIMEDYNIGEPDIIRKIPVFKGADPVPTGTPNVIYVGGGIGLSNTTSPINWDNYNYDDDATTVTFTSNY